MKVLFLYDSTYGDSFFVGFGTELQKMGNDLLLLNLHNLPNIDTAILEITDFNADIAFSFNFPFGEKLFKYLPKTTIVYDIDTPQNIIDIEYFSKLLNQGKLFYFSAQRNYKELFIQNKLKIKNFTKCFYVPLATNFVNKVMKISRNICFCGTNWDYNLYAISSSIRSDNLNSIYSQMMSNYFNINNPCYNALGKDEKFLLKWNIAGTERTLFLSELTDLGLEIYGDRWDKLIYNYQVLKCCTFKKIETLLDLNNLYNSSKISVNFSHPQAKESFSFRVMDIMASNSCLLTEYKESWDDLFREYLSKEVIDAVTFKTRFEMRQKALLLLKDDSLRKKCVKELNSAIKKNGRWSHRIKSMEKYLNINFSEHKSGSIKIKNFSALNNQQYEIKKNNKIIKSIKKIIASFLILISSIPLIGKLVVKKNLLVKSINLIYPKE